MKEEEALKPIEEWKAAVARGETTESFPVWEEKQQEKKVLALLPSATKTGASTPRLTIHRDHVGVTYAKKYPDRYPLHEIMAIYNQWKPNIVPAENWKSTFRAIRPAEINEVAKEGEKSHMDGEAWVSLVLHAGRGFESHHVGWWAKIDGQLFHIKVELRPDHRWLPQVKNRYDEGEVISSSVMPVYIGEDWRGQWWTPPGGFQLEYTWADSHNWEAFASR